MFAFFSLRNEKDGQTHVYAIQNTGSLPKNSVQAIVSTQRQTLSRESTTSMQHCF